MTSTLSGKSCLSFLSSANNEMEVINFDFFFFFFFIHLFIYLFIITIFFSFSWSFIKYKWDEQKATDYLN